MALQLKNIVEAALLAAGRPLSLEAIQGLFPEIECPDKPELRSALQQLSEDYQDRGIEITEVSSGWRIQVREVCSPWVSRLWEERPARYSRALMETLALIAYRQPITRGEVEDVRGVSVSTNIIKTLMEREWVRVLGHRDVPGRPALYGTTREFLDYFGLKSLDELPTLAELRDLDEINRELDLSDPDSLENDDGRTSDAAEGQATHAAEDVGHGPAYGGDEPDESDQAAQGTPGVGEATPAEQDVGRSPTYADADRQGADPVVDTDAAAAPQADAEAQTPPSVGQAAPAEQAVGRSPADTDGDSAPEPQRENAPGSDAPADRMSGPR